MIIQVKKVKYSLIMERMGENVFLSTCKFPKLNYIKPICNFLSKPPMFQMTSCVYMLFFT